MRATITHITAACHWLMTTMDGNGLRGLERSATLGACPTRVSQLARLDLEDYRIDGHRTDLLVTDSGCCPTPALYAYHTSCRDYPPGSFVALEGGIQIASPELSCWQMSKVLPLGELVKYGDALCSRHSYAIGPDGRLLRRRAPLTTVDKLSRFARKMGSTRRNPEMFRALRYLVDESDSPMETCVTILLGLKRQYGGMGFPRPCMNHVVELDEVARQLAKTDTCRCDMYWPDQRYDLEYDSDQEHGGDRATQDALRRTAIRRMGIRVAELRTPQVTDSDMFLAAARVIAQDLELRTRTYSPEEEFKHHLAYTDLRRQIFHWERFGSSMDASPLRIGDLDW